MQQPCCRHATCTALDCIDNGSPRLQVSALACIKATNVGHCVVRLMHNIEASTLLDERDSSTVTACMASMRIKAPTESQDAERSPTKTKGKSSGSWAPCGNLALGRKQIPTSSSKSVEAMSHNLHSNIWLLIEVRPSRPGLKVATFKVGSANLHRPASNLVACLAWLMSKPPA